MVHSKSCQWLTHSVKVAATLTTTCIDLKKFLCHYLFIFIYQFIYKLGGGVKCLYNWGVPTVLPKCFKLQKTEPSFFFFFFFC